MRRPTAATDALGAPSGGLPDNAELAERLPIELCRAGFGRVLFSRIERNMWVVRSAHIAGDPDLTATLLAGRPRASATTVPAPAGKRDGARQGTDIW